MTLDTQFFTHCAATVWLIGVVLVVAGAIIAAEICLAWDLLREVVCGYGNDEDMSDEK